MGLGSISTFTQMKILFCVEFYYPSVGGAQEVVRRLAERMASRGHSVCVATSNIAERAANTHNGVSIYGFDVSGNKVNGIHGAVGAYQNFLTSEKFDLIFFYAAQQWTFDAAWPVLPATRAKVVFVPCGYSGFYEKAYKKYFEDLPKILKTLDAVVYHAESYRDIDYARTLGLKNSYVIPNGADLDEFCVSVDPQFRSEMGIGDDELIMLTVGTLTGTKGHLEVLQAYSQLELNGKKCVLILNGNRPEHHVSMLSVLGRLLVYVRNNGPYYTLRRVVKRCLNSLGFEVGIKTRTIENWMDEVNLDPSNSKRVIQINLPRPRLVQAFLQSDLFVFASKIEYSPLVLFEACAAGLPFLSTDVGNVKEIIDWTKGGELCEAAIDARGYSTVDPRVLARRMEAILGDPNKLSQLAKNGRAAVINRFNWDALASEYETLFFRLVNHE
jgi:L-malate glycosyltransferase